MDCVDDEPAVALGRRGVTLAESQPELTADTILQEGELVDGKYRVERLLGAGGMAAVWAGTNERTGKQVALKVILRSLATTRVAQGLFRREVLAASLVNHPNVVTIFDVIEHEGMACIVMELLEGEPLGSTIARKGFLGVNEATMLLLPAMRGVAAANAQGVIHRDLKPPNIFICMEPDGRIITTKVLDFGISVMVERGTGPSAAPILAMGTPAYMSPEHILGVPDIDARADVYGFGLLLYESLTGQMAFPGEPGPVLFDCVLHEPAVPVTVVRPDLPVGLVRIIEKAMAKDRDQRYADVNSLAMALEDELTPATPAPRLLTPQAGVPSFVARDPGSGPHVPRAVLNREPSEQHQGTRILYVFPLQTEGKEDTAPAGPNGGSGGSEGGPEEAASLPTTDRETARVDLRAWLPTKRSSGIGVRSALRVWRALLGVGFAVAIGFLAVSVAMRGARKVHAPAPIANGAPPAREPVAQSAVPASPADPVAAAAPLTISSSPSALATRGQNPSVRALRDRSVPVTPRRLLVAERETSNNVPPPPHALRGASEKDQPAHAPSRRAGTSAKSPAPRAGPLSKDDF
jgi:serine/threonine protein kinase